MKMNVAADNSFFSCNVCDLHQIDTLIKYLDLYRFHAGSIILDTEFPEPLKNRPDILGKIQRHEAKYAELFRVENFSRTKNHLENDGEYEAIGIALELLRNGDLHCLILDDKKPRNYVMNAYSNEFPELRDKLHGTFGFIADSCIKDKLVSKDDCLNHLKAIYTAYQEHKDGKKAHRPCSIDEKLAPKLLEIIHKLEEN